MPYRIPACAGKPYRPSNGTEGEMFIDTFCANCVHEEYVRTGADDAKKCDILSRAFWADINGPDYPKEWTHNTEGEPVCTAFERRP